MNEKDLSDILGIRESEDSEENVTTSQEQVPDQNMPSSNNPAEQESHSYLSLIGGAVAMFSFFAPWAGCENQTISGYDLGDDKWLVFLAGGIIVGSFFFFLNAKKLEKAKPSILISSIIGIVYMLYLYIEMQGNEFAKHMEVKWGGITTIGGFILALIGVQFLKSPKQPTPSEQVLFCGGCGKKYQVRNMGAFCVECGNKL